jgi:Uma2 family endonuclease
MAERVLRPAPMTLEDAARLDPDLYPGEVIQGEWRPVSRSTWRHGEIMLTVGMILRQYARSHPGWRVAVGDPGSKLGSEPATLRGPDAAVIREDRRPDGKGVEGWREGAPDLAVEILGDDQSTSDLLERAVEYLAAGSRMVWILEPEPTRVLVVTPPNQFQVLGPEATLDGGAALPGFSCSVAELFEQ